MSITAVILAGGRGTRMKSALPKQYLTLDSKPIAAHSIELFLAHPEIATCIVVAAEEYRSYLDYPVTFAEPGERRQDSLYNALQHVETEWVCVHDAARPYLTRDLVSHLIAEAISVSAATLAMPVKNTLKERDARGFVKQTLDRDVVWEVQTPQLVKKEVLELGFAHAQAHALTVTDDVSLAELVGEPVKLVKGDYRNIKITTPDDLDAKI